ncbi:hypothetical protein RFF05_05995 [Bengtsoniella intestinalis]|uniref:hypothetical protein n=1 Tax=Bengtsoniella intestinalis TaxID=3073143 RepID=UPI00391F7B19
MISFEGGVTPRTPPDVAKLEVSFVAALPEEKYPELIQYLKERRLYVSEPVEVEEEK